MPGVLNKDWLSQGGAGRRATRPRAKSFFLHLFSGTRWEGDLGDAVVTEGVARGFQMDIINVDIVVSPVVDLL